ncbi:hypothetical protein DVK85_06730 [Flavobacterium arcticum]|uniref:Uncharacterized protein n=1 Tax=Flavobacterium arcticum TaxID=1784713 RepID=A0A345HBJ5_9FLAO|nr:hypothetical protein [Flavobacterium arcticum]AXG73955.1 hypothetical protein DVK85_06730 [Flavobacterium arcticum]KAF2508931.1 hypothetical protein E0W72_10215 [Flavobacterium arcticum]
MKDLLKDFLETSRDRIKTPITGSFALAFLLWNWRPILVLLLSDSSIENKIKHIDKNYCGYWALLAPLLIAIFYTLLVPYLTMIIERMTLGAIKGQRYNKKVLDKLEEEQNRISQEYELMKASREFEIEQIKSGQRSINELSERIASLEAKLQASKN